MPTSKLIVPILVGLALTFVISICSFYYGQYQVMSDLKIDSKAEYEIFREKYKDFLTTTLNVRNKLQTCPELKGQILVDNMNMLLYTMVNSSKIAERMYLEIRNNETTIKECQDALAVGLEISRNGVIMVKQYDRK